MTHPAEPVATEVYRKEGVVALSKILEDLVVKPNLPQGTQTGYCLCREAVTWRSRARAGETEKAKDGEAEQWTECKARDGRDSRDI